MTEGFQNATPQRRSLDLVTDMESLGSLGSDDILAITFEETAALGSSLSGPINLTPNYFLGNHTLHGL